MATIPGRVTRFKNGEGAVELKSGAVLPFSSDEIFSIGDKVAVQVGNTGVTGIKRLGTGRGWLTRFKSATEESGYWKRGKDKYR